MNPLFQRMRIYPFACLFGAMLVASWSSLAEVKLLTPAGYLPGIPLLVRVEVLQPDGTRDVDCWEAETILSVDPPGLTLSTNRVVLRNGLGSTLVVISGGGNLHLTATARGESSTRALASLVDTPVFRAGGTLAGSNTTWSGVVRITNTLTVPVGCQLTIESNTWVLVDGVASGTAGPGLVIQGSIESLGTELHPVTFTCAAPALRWGQVRHESARPSLYRHTSITRAGRAPPEGQTGQAPVVRSGNSSITFESCNLTDHAEIARGMADYGTPGRVLAASGSHLTLNNCLLSRARMGVEAQGSSVLLTNCHLTDMRGPNDADGLYFLAQSGGQEVCLSGCVLAGGDDDGIDTLNASIAVENCIIRGWDNRTEDAKGMSLLNGVTRVRGTLIVDCTAGMAAKWNAGPPTLVTLDRCTLAGNLTNVLAQRRPNAPGPFIDCRIANSILWGGDAVASDFGPTNFTVRYSDLSEPWPGPGNLSAPPLFLNEVAHNYHLEPDSPCIDMGDPASPPDPDDSRADMGALPFDPALVPPVMVSVLAPLDGTTFIGPTNILIEARAMASTGSILRVEFYQGSTWLGADLDSPFRWLWSPMVPGDYDVRVVATDASGHSATSSVVRVTVNPDPAPGMTGIEPPPGATLLSLTAVSVWFSEPVTGVNETDLLMNSVAASTVTGFGAGPYTFGFAQPPPGVVLLNWAADCGIEDAASNVFVGNSWSYTLDTNAGRVVISEIMYHPSSEDPGEEFIELYNPSPVPLELGAWRFSGGVQFVFSANTRIEAGDYLVVAADVATFSAKRPEVTHVVGNWQGTLSNRGEEIALDDDAGQRVRSVRYAAEGDWAWRRRGAPSPLANSPYRGWVWLAEHDGLGRSLELINPRMPGQYGQNWAASLAENGTPGRPNSVANTNTAPLIAEVSHLPIIPRSTDPVTITARVLDEQPFTQGVRLFYRVDALPTNSFSSAPMFDDGVHGDGVAGDGIYGAALTPEPHATVVEFYVEAIDVLAQARTWPGSACETNGLSLGQVVNALYQVDDSVDSGSQPVYRLIMTGRERAELAAIGSGTFALWPAPPGTSQSDAQMNGTFISADGTGLECRYRVGLKNRGHATRNRKPNNCRVNFPADNPWKGVAALNLNGQYTYAQVVGAALCQHAGLAGAESRGVQVRVNSTNLALGGSSPLPAFHLTYGSYAANEVLDADWAEHQFPSDGNGHGYQVVRDIELPSASFDFRGPGPHAYTNTYFKRTHESEEDWADLIGMLRIMGTNDLFTTENVRRVINVEQWLTHLAVMAIMANAETGLNSGWNDDYTLYFGAEDPRAVLVCYDLDTVLGEGNSTPGPTATIWGATMLHGDGDSGSAMNRFLHWPDFEPIYHWTLQRLLDTTFAKPFFDALLDQTVGSYVPADVIARMKTWMDLRRSYIRGLIATNVVPNSFRPVATIAGEPRSPTPLTGATLLVSGEGITHYRFKLNLDPFGAEITAEESLILTGLTHGSTNTVFVMGRGTNGHWQSPDAPTISRSWVVCTNWPAVRINEILAHNDSAVSHEGTHPDLIELFNEGDASVDLAGLRLADRPDTPGRFAFPTNTILGPGACLVLYANEPDGTSGLHLGFALSQDGDRVYLFDRPDRGGALLDAVAFGVQVAGLSIGRIGGSGDFVLTQPTFGRANVPQPLGDGRALKINEWLAAGQNLFPDDYIELLNPDLQPVALGGLHLTDAPVGAPHRHALAPLSFIAGGGFALFYADGDAHEGSNHLNFQLASEQGQVALTALDGSPMDHVLYGPQRLGVAEGRCPDGGWQVVTLPVPTPGGPNACPSQPPPPQLLALVGISNVWRYDVSGADLGPAWTAPGYDDGAWRNGAALLFDPPNRPYTLPERVRTWLPPASGIVTYRFRTLFTLPETVPFTSLQFSHVVDDGAVFYLNGHEFGRFNMPEGTISNATLATMVSDAVRVGPVPLELAQVWPGENVLAVEVHQDSPSSADVCFGLVLEGVIATNSPALAGVVLNEVLANNASLRQPDGSTPDWVEIHNPSTNAVDLGGLSLTDDPGDPRRWVFPPGSVLLPRGFLAVFCEAERPPSALNTGFGLKTTGDAVYLFDAPADGGGLRDAIAFGIQTPNFSIGRYRDGGSNWVLLTTTPGARNTAAPLGAVADLELNEWMAAPPPGEDDWFELYNSGVLPAALGGLYLTDVLNETTRYPPIPALSFIGTGSNAFQKFMADGNPAAGADHVRFALKAAGEALGLARPNGQLIDGIAFGPQPTGVSQGRLPDGDGPVVFFALSASPGAANYLVHPGVVISEVLSGSPVNAPCEDAIELQNLGDQPVDISGWWLSDAPRSPCKYQIEPDTVLAPGRFKVFYEYQFNRSESAAVPFALSSAEGDEVWLSAVDSNGLLNGYRAGTTFGPVEDLVCVGRWETSLGADFVALSRPTFGVLNPATVEQFRTGGGQSNAPARVGPVVIRQIMYHPPVPNAALEFVELRNVTAQPVPMHDPERPTNTWRLRQGVEFDFPTNFTLPPCGSVALVGFDALADPAALGAFQAAYGTNMLLLGPWRGQLDNAGERLELLRPLVPELDGTTPYTLADHVEYDDAAPWPVVADGAGASLQKPDASSYGNEPSSWIAAPPGLGPILGGDCDNDGMPDAWETRHGLDPTDPLDADRDADHDGASNWQEWASDTDPNDPASRLRLKRARLWENQVAIDFLAMPGRTYSVLCCRCLGDGAWWTVADIPASDAAREMTVYDSFDGGQRFYRLVTPALPARDPTP